MSELTAMSIIIAMSMIIIAYLTADIAAGYYGHPRYVLFFSSISRMRS